MQVGHRDVGCGLGASAGLACRLGYKGAELRRRCTFCPWKGGKPVRNSYRMTPKDHQSHAASKPRARPWIASGACLGVGVG